MSKKDKLDERLTLAHRDLSNSIHKIHKKYQLNNPEIIGLLSGIITMTTFLSLRKKE